MATKLFLRNTTDSGIVDTGDGILYDMVATAGASADTAVTDTQASGTQIQLTKASGGSTIAWISGRVPAGGFTLTLTNVSAWFQESNMNANVGARARLFRREPDGSLTELGGGPFDDLVEFTGSNAEYAWTCNVTDQAFNENDRILLRLYLTNVGTMGGGFTATLTFNGPDAAAGDSDLTLTETVSFKAEETLSPGAIASAEAFGSPLVNQEVQAPAVASAAAFGALSIALLVTAQGIPSAETFGSPAVAQELVPVSIPSAEVFGSQELDQELQAGAVASGEAFGSHSVSVGGADQTVSPSSIASAEAFGSTSLHQALSLQSIAPAEAFGSALLQQQVSVSGIPSAEGFGALFLHQQVSLSAIISAEAFGSHVVTVSGGDQAIAPASIASAEGFGSSALHQSTSAQGIPSAEVLGSLSLHQAIAGAGAISSLGTIGSATVQLAIAAPGISSFEAFGVGALQLEVTPPAIASAEAFGLASLGGGAGGVATPVQELRTVSARSRGTGGSSQRRMSLTGVRTTGPMD